MKKSISYSLSGLFGTIVGAMLMKSVFNKELRLKAEKVDKFKSYYNMLNQWLILKQNGISLEKYFINNGYKNIAIYGMGEMGCRLYEELRRSDINVKYVVDENTIGTDFDIEVLGKNDNFEKVDVMVVTAIFAFNEITEEIRKRSLFPIVSLDDIVYEIHD